MKRSYLVLFMLLTASVSLFANTGESSDLTMQMTSLVLELGVVIFAVRAGGIIAAKLGMPSVIGELLTGVIIGPYALGSLPLPGFPHGLFQIYEGFAVSPVLYAFATVASIILLFTSGLETDINMFLSYSVAGGLIGLGGVAVSYLFGAGLGSIFLHQSVFAPSSMFLGIMSTATSVGITARILSDKKKMDSPEGVTILAAAVFDDVIGIVLLAIVMGVVAVMTGHQAGGLSLWRIGSIALKAFGLWLGFTALGLFFGKKLGEVLKKIGGDAHYPVLALGLALILAGFFEMQGLAMIIGAYIIGISLSKTDIAYLIMDKTKPLYDFFVPVFFAVMGMMVDVNQLLSPSVLLFGGIYTLLAILAKIIGAGLPAMFLGFNFRGSLRIGLGMVPRGEVALIIAGIGLSAGVLEPSIFGVSILMTMVTSIIAPPLLNIALTRGGQGTKQETKGNETETIEIKLPTRELAELVSSTFLRELEREGFFVQHMSIRDEISHIRKGDISFSLVTEDKTIRIETDPIDVVFIKSFLHEIMVQLDSNFEKLKATFDPEKLRQDLHVQSGRKVVAFQKILDLDCITTELKGNTKYEVIEELVNLLEKAGKVEDKETLLKDIIDREERMSTGMEHGIALPHARTSGIKSQTLAIGIHKRGVNFQTIDGSQVHILAMILTPSGEEAPHMQVLASLGAVLGDEKIRNLLINTDSPQDVYESLLK
ncbi:fructose PTS transporter subunit IIA [Gracilinema caldarium]|uniref:fructose PTS transporter subunit IIA n=1 Tax=Gracilinema caldarium TaxID=215591 RepID=UPI0026E95883|nr:fructose PTS transporter subunit IIA [Gracilinema caldarium]